MRSRRLRTPAIRALPTLAIVWSCGDDPVAPAASIAEFEQRLEDLRARSHIPAITAVIALGDDVVWAKGYGMADIAANRPAADTTVYHVASLTKPVAATIILQLVEEGLVSLDDPVSDYDIPLGSPGTIRLRHLLSHTSHDQPGAGFRYDGNRFSHLDSVIVRRAGKSFAAALHERIVSPLGLRHTAPNPRSADFTASGLDKATFEANLARGYIYTDGRYVLTSFFSYFGAASGLTASALDMVAFSHALDADVLLRPESKTLAFTPVVATDGDTLPYGLGWFATRYQGVSVIWHYGYDTAISALIIKVPSRDLTFVVLGNTDGLSAPYGLGSGDLADSPWAREFLDAFVIGSARLPSPGAS